ncbi:hypothetical protein FGG08_005015 [Glutinoglossum americanum]|uniref:HOOK N-terminal domain-containing protein n=1 Tax=Glutinoglossum americanum TaxID=1670608 RepID=A0A9P8L1U7_9PEZI|nr:hypothetical protein FGG08_005015 [Glutinoglossum americanum]
MSADAAVAAALIEWINDFSIPDKVTTLKEFSDGVLLRRVLREIDHNYFAALLPDLAPPAYWLPKFQSCMSSEAWGFPPRMFCVDFVLVKETYKALKTYIRDVCNQALPERPSDVPNLKAIAEKASEVDTIQLLKLVLFAAIYSPRNDEYILKMQKLSLNAQESIKIVIEAMQTGSSGSITPAIQEPGKQPHGLEAGIDPGLFYEERLGTFMAENDTLIKDKKALQVEVTELTNRLGRLQENNQILQDRLTEAEGKMRDLIADQESKLAQQHTESRVLYKTIEGLQVTVTSVQKTRDELDEIKVERDQLAKKANTLDKFKQKLREAQTLEHENKELQQTLEEIKNEQKTGDNARQELAGVKMMIQQYRSTVEKVEQDNHELLTLKRHLEIENSALAQKLSSNVEQQARDTELIQDLQEKIHDLEAGALPGRATSIEDDLDTELVYSDESKTDLKIEIAALKVEIQVLKESGGSGAKVVMLEGLLEDARLSRDKYLQLYLDDHQAKLVLESQLSAVQEGTLTEGFATNGHGERISTNKLDRSELFLKVRTALIEAEANLSEARKRLSDTEEKLKITQRDLNTAKSDLSLVGKDERDALAGLRDRNTQDVIELKAEGDDLRAKVKSVQTDLEQHRLLLNYALVEKDATQKSLIDQKDKYHELEIAHKDFKATLDILNASYEGREEGQKESLDEHVAKLQTKVENYREKGAKRQEHIKKQKALIKEFQERLQRAEEGDRETMAKAKETLLMEQKVRWRGETHHHHPDKPPRKYETDDTHPKIQNAKQQELLNLQRENSLMATAWYDLSSRLQTNSVVLLRRNDPPVGWLKKQRHLLSAPTVR